MSGLPVRLREQWPRSAEHTELKCSKSDQETPLSPITKSEPETDIADWPVEISAKPDSGGNSVNLATRDTEDLKNAWNEKNNRKKLSAMLGDTATLGGRFREQKMTMKKAKRQLRKIERLQRRIVARAEIRASLLESNEVLCSRPHATGKVD